MSVNWEDLKTKGNEFFLVRDFGMAIEQYSLAISFLSLKETFHLSRLLSNRAACYLAQEDYTKSVEDSREALKNDHLNIKAHFRLAKGLLGIDEEGNKEEAIVHAALALALSSDDKSLADFYSSISNDNPLLVVMYSKEKQREYARRMASSNETWVSTI